MHGLKDVVHLFILMVLATFTRLHWNDKSGIEGRAIQQEGPL